MVAFFLGVGFGISAGIIGTIAFFMSEKPL